MRGYLDAIEPNMSAPLKWHCYIYKQVNPLFSDGFSQQIDALSMEMSIVYFKGISLNFQNYFYVGPWKVF